MFLPYDVGTSTILSRKVRYTTSLKKSPIHNFQSYLVSTEVARATNPSVYWRVCWLTTGGDDGQRTPGTIALLGRRAVCAEEGFGTPGVPVGRKVSEVAQQKTQLGTYPLAGRRVQGYGGQVDDGPRGRAATGIGVAAVEGIVSPREIRRLLASSWTQCWNASSVLMSVRWQAWCYGVLVLVGYRAWGLTRGRIRPPRRW